MEASSRISSSEVIGGCSVGRRNLVKAWIAAIAGRSATTRARTDSATGAARASRKVKPSVLGTISVHSRMASVKTSEKIHSVDGSNTSPYLAPATAAPIVWANVFRMRIAAIGASIERLKPSRIAPARFPSRLSASTRACPTLSSTDSKIEQRNDTTSAVVTASMKRIIVDSGRARAGPGPRFDVEARFYSRFE